MAAATEPWQAALALFLCGLGSSVHYPLAVAAAHRALPGRPGRVEALQHLLSPLELAAPVVFGLLADTCGLRVALLGLALQPLLVAALVHGRGPSSGRASGARSRGP